MRLRSALALIPLLAAGFLLGRLPFPLSSAEDPPQPATESHECPFCHQGLEVPDTPAGAFMKVKIGVATENVALLKANLLGFDGVTTRDAGAALRTLTAQLVKVDEKGDTAVLVLQMGNGVVDLPCVKDEGHWKVDIRVYRDQQIAGASRGVLADLGTRIKRYFENRGKAPRSGEDLWTDLKDAGLIETRHLNTPRDAARVTPEEFDRGEWGKCAFRVTRDPIARDLPPGKPLLWEKSPRDGKRLVLYASGLVVELESGPFDAAIEKYEGNPGK
ncbi:MAG: hypothetical protein FD180_4251 [Planctomycetota bacterium]|nr:MAG: hypothetical protein FD180_4251 [Planctomycetota bacterium]